MVKGFWKKLKENGSVISILAPMYDVTDVVFRSIVESTARPDIFFTEFVNAEAFLSKGRDAVVRKLKYTHSQQPVVAQIWGTKPEDYCAFAKELVEMGFSGIDINMGCPEKTVLKIGACSALIGNQTLAKEIILATIEGAGNIPVSVKTRTGLKKHTTEEWLGFLLSFDLSAITLHARTVKQLSEVPADWTQVGVAASLRNASGEDTLIIGNGDVKNWFHGADLCKTYGCDGFMIGRGIFSDLFAFSQDKSQVDFTMQARLALLHKHLELFQQEYSGERNYHVLKKYFKIYLNGFDGAAKLREQFMSTDNIEEALALVIGLGIKS